MGRTAGKIVILRVFICAVFLLTNHYLFAQTAIKGNVTDSLANPIAGANVLLFQQDFLVSYSFTDELGFYHLEDIDPGIYFLRVSSLSFETKDIQVELSKESNRDFVKVDFSLSFTYDSLDEVVLDVERDIEIRNDTIIFRADAFKRRNDAVLEDLLENLPGIQVGEDGVIQFQGKPVTRVKIENDDLFEGGYKVLTKNLHSEVVDKVQILQNYSHNTLLKGIEDSEDIALNITLKKDRKTTLFGNAHVSAGTRERYSAKANFISFLKNSKFYVFSDFNNIGRNSGGEIDGLLNPPNFSSDRTQTIGRGYGAYTFLGINTKRPQLSDHISNINNAKFGSLNSIFNLAENIKLKGLLLYSGDKKDFNHNERTKFFTEDPVIIYEDYDIYRKENLLFGKIDLNWDIDEESKIEYTGTISKGRAVTFADLYQNQGEVKEDLSYDAIKNNHLLSYTTRYSDSTAFVVAGRYINDQRPQQYIVRPYTYGHFFPTSEDFKESLAFSENKLNYKGIQASVITNVKNSNLFFQLGWEERKDDLFSFLKFSNSEGMDFLADSNFINNLEFVKSKTFLQGGYRLKKTNWEIFADIGINYIFSNLTFKEEQESVKEDFFVQNSQLNVEFKPNKKHELNLGARINENTGTLNSMVNSFVPLNYRSFYKGLGEDNLLRSYSTNFSYTYGNWADEFLANFFSSYRYDEKFYSTNAYLGVNLTVLEQIILKDRQNYTTGANIDRYLNFLKSNLKMKSSFSLGESKDVVNDSFRTVEFQQWTYGFEIRSAFSGFFNYTLGSSWYFTKYRFMNTSHSNTNNKSFLDLDFVLSKKMNFGFKNERYHFGSLSGKSDTYYFTDIDVEYIFKENSLSAHLKVNNLFDHSSFHIYSLNELNEFTSETKLIPRYFLLSLDFRF